MGKRMAICVGGLAVAVLASFGVYFLVNWKQVETEYHLLQLARDSDYLARILASPEGTAERVAVLRYTGSPEGARHLLRLYVSALIMARPGGDGLLNVEGCVLGYHRTRVQAYLLGAQRTRGFSVTAWRSLVGDDRLAILHQFVREHELASFEGFELRDHEGFVFQVVPASWAPILTDLAGSGNQFEGPVCVARGKIGAGPALPKPHTVPALLKALGAETQEEDLAPYLEKARESKDGAVRRAAKHGLELLAQNDAER